jgi:hypothetical protein
MQEATANWGNMMNLECGECPVEKKIQDHVITLQKLYPRWQDIAFKSDSRAELHMRDLTSSSTESVWLCSISNWGALDFGGPTLDIW